MKNKSLISVLTILLFLINNISVFAQCAMCKATASSDLDSGGSIATGLNTGIFYLMAIPYLLLMIGGYFFFKKSVDEKIRSLRDKFFGSVKS